MATKLPRNKLHLKDTIMDTQTNEIQNTPISPVITIETKIGRIDEGVGVVSANKLPFTNLPDELFLQREKDLTHQSNLNDVFQHTLSTVADDQKDYKDKTDRVISTIKHMIKIDRDELTAAKTYFETNINNLETVISDNHTSFDEFVIKTEDRLNLFEQDLLSQNNKLNNKLKRLEKILWITGVVSYAALSGVLMLVFFPTYF